MPQEGDGDLIDADQQRFTQEGRLKEITGVSWHFDSATDHFMSGPMNVATAGKISKAMSDIASGGVYVENACSVRSCGPTNMARLSISEPFANALMQAHEGKNIEQTIAASLGISTGRGPA